jgi:hypothetical protein
MMVIDRGDLSSGGLFLPAIAALAPRLRPTETSIETVPLVGRISLGQ